MFGLIGKMRAHPGKRGCLSYVVARDPADADAIWVTEVWTDAASHKASLSLPEVQEAIAKARPLIAGFDSSMATEPVGGVGIPVAKS